MLSQMSNSAHRNNSKVCKESLTSLTCLCFSATTPNLSLTSSETLNRYLCPCSVFFLTHSLSAETSPRNCTQFGANSGFRKRCALFIDFSDAPAEKLAAFLEQMQFLQRQLVGDWVSVVADTDITVDDNECEDVASFCSECLERSVGVGGGWRAE